MKKKTSSPPPSHRQSRRNFFKTTAKFSSLFATPLLSGHLPSFFSLDNFQVFWIHLEGAPVRWGWDLWIDPLHLTTDHDHFLSQKTLTKIKSKNLYLPLFWKKYSQFLPLLENWLLIRGLETNGPHLKESRTQWFSSSSPQSPKPLLDEFDSLFKEKWNGQTCRFYPQSKRTELLNEKAIGRKGQRILPSKKENQNITGLSDIFAHWFLEVQKREKEQCPVHLAIFRGLDDTKGPLFEELKKWGSKERLIHEKFYFNLTKNLFHFVQHLKRVQRYHKTAIIITNDRARAPIEKKENPRLDITWQGINLSILSGALSGPNYIGDIFKEHPHYSSSYPSTWGVGVTPFFPSHVHRLISDLCLAQERSTQYKRKEENPWLAPRRFQELFIKGHSGKILSPQSPPNEREENT